MERSMLEESWDSTQKPLHSKRTEFDMKMKSLEIYLSSLPIKESEITDFFRGASPKKDEVLKLMSVQKLAWAG